MPKKRITFDTVREIGLALPDVEEGTVYRTPALKVRGKMFTCIPNHKSAEPDSLAIMMDFAQRDELLANDPKTYYVKEHYVNYPVILVRLAHVHPDALRDLVLGAWRFVSTTGAKRGGVRKAKRPPARTRR